MSRTKAKARKGGGKSGLPRQQPEPQKQQQEQQQQQPEQQQQEQQQDQPELLLGAKRELEDTSNDQQLESHKKQKKEKESSGVQTLYKGRYTKWKKHSRLFGTSEQIKGVLVTCQKAREAQSIGEVLTLLNAYADKYFPEPAPASEKTDNKEKVDMKMFLHSRGLEVDDDEDKDDADDDADDVTTSSTSTTSTTTTTSTTDTGAAASTTPTKVKRFELINAGCHNMFAISILQSNVDVITFLSLIIVDIYRRCHPNGDHFKQLPPTVEAMLASGKPDVVIPERALNIKFTNRLTPIQRSTVASLDSDVMPIMEKMVDKAFGQEQPCTFGIEMRERNNVTFDKTKAIDKIAQLVKAPHKVNLSNPDKTIVIEIIKSAVTMAIVDNYKHFFKFNIQEAIKPSQKKPQPQQQPQQQQPQSRQQQQPQSRQQQPQQQEQPEPQPQPEHPVQLDQ